MRKLGANACGKIRRGRDFDHLLMPPLHGAVALVKMQQVAVMIPQDLHFEMPRTRQIFFQEHGSVTERRVRFRVPGKIFASCAASRRDRKSTRLNSSHEWISY